MYNPRCAQAFAVKPKETPKPTPKPKAKLPKATDHPPKKKAKLEPENCDVVDDDWDFSDDDGSGGE